jgi:hypothetical protein
VEERGWSSFGLDVSRFGEASDVEVFVAWTTFARDDGDDERSRLSTDVIVKFLVKVFEYELVTTRKKKSVFPIDQCSLHYTSMVFR